MNLTAKRGGTRSKRRRKSSRRPRGAAAAAMGIVGAAAAAAFAKRSRNGGPQVHTSPDEGHPAGTGVRTDRDIGGPTSSPEETSGNATGGAPGTPPDSGFEPHS